MHASSSSLAEPLNQHNNIESDLESQHHQQVELHTLQSPSSSSSSSSLLPPTRLLSVPERHHLLAPPPALARSVVESLNEYDESGLTTLAILSPDTQNRFPTSLPPALNNYIDANTYRATIERCNNAFTLRTGGIITGICALIAFISCGILYFVLNANPGDLQGVSINFLVTVSVLFALSFAFTMYSAYKENRLQVSGLCAVLELENVNYELRARSSGSSETHLTHTPLVWTIITTPGEGACDDALSRKYQIRISSQVIETPGGPSSQ